MALDESDKKQWDAGLNAGLVHRPPEQTKEGDTRPRPAYYAEASSPSYYAKAVIYAVIAIVPYLAVFDTLGHNKDFLPCNGAACHYVRIFNSRYIPGTGINVMGVRNGMERPMGLHHHGFSFNFTSYACPLLDENRSFLSQLIWGDEAHSCPHNAEMNGTLEADLGIHSTTQETDYAQHMSLLLKLEFLFCKAPLWIFAYPMVLLSKTNPLWGMEHVPSALCPGWSEEKMQDRCIELNKANLESENGDVISNPLRAYSPARIGVYVGLYGYATCTAVHDILLLRGVKEKYTLTLGFCATCFYGMAAIFVFAWAMGAAEVFAAPALDNDIHKCACYYYIPEVTALIALATPFALFAGFMSRVQMQGLAALFGDFLTYQTYYVPHYLAKQSTFWSWACLCSPKCAGTITGDPRETFSAKEARDNPTEAAKNWKWLSEQQTILYWLSVFVQVVVALSASGFVIGVKELSVSLYMRGDMPPLVQGLIKYVVFPLPSVAVLGIGIMAIYDLYCTTIGVDPGETFVGQAITLIPLLKLCMPKELLGNQKQRTDLDQRLGIIAFCFGAVLLASWTSAVAHGMSPDLNFMLGREELHHPKVAQAELWGACGFVFFLVHIPRVMSIAFSTWDDMESLKFLSNPKENPGYSPLGPPP